MSATEIPTDARRKALQQLARADAREMVAKAEHRVRVEMADARRAAWHGFHEDVAWYVGRARKANRVARIARLCL